jgi:hypothetical protein
VITISYFLFTSYVGIKATIADLDFLASFNILEHMFMAWPFRDLWLSDVSGSASLKVIFYMNRIASLAVMF